MVAMETEKVSPPQYTGTTYDGVPQAPQSPAQSYQPYNTPQHTGAPLASPPPPQQQQYTAAPQGLPQGQQQGFQPRQYNIAVPISNLQAQPQPVDCPNCHGRYLTNAQFQSGNTTNAWALGLFITTCCCCIPYLIDGTKDVVHKCSNCGINLATWHRSGRTEVHVH